MRLGRVTRVEGARAFVDFGAGELGPFPWGAARAGRVKIWSRPSAGEQVLVFCPGGDPERAVLGPAVFWNDEPAPTLDGRELVQFGDGATLAYDDASHRLHASLPAGGEILLVAPGGVIIAGDLEVQGEITATGDVRAGAVSLKDHRHGQVAPGSGQSGGPA